MNPKALLGTPHPWLERVSAAIGLPPNAIAAAIMLACGVAIAFVLRGLTRRLVGRGARLMQSLYAKGSGAPSTERLERATGDAIYWLVIVCAVMAATEMLGLPVVTTWLSGVASFLPRVAAAVLIAAFGTASARLVRHLIARAASSARLSSADRLARLGEIVILVGTSLIAVDELGIEVSFLKSSLLIVLGTTLGGLALGFALGGRELVANVLSAHYVHKLYAVGQTVRIGDIEGRILRITETFVVLECVEGSVAIPARAFSDTRSTLVLARSGE
jgi:hypothetical protein